MAAYLRYSGNGTNSTFSSSFTGGGALRASHIKVYVDEILKANGVNFDISADLTQVVFRAGHIPPAGTDNVVIIRETPGTAATRVVDFQPGAILTATNLDEAVLNAMYMSQEEGDKNQLEYSPVTDSIDGNGVTVTNISLDFGPVP